MTELQFIDATDQVGDDFEAGKIVRTEAEARLSRLGYDPHEITDMLDALCDPVAS